MAQQASILLVDDDADLCNMLEFYFKNLGYTVYIARRAADGIKQAIMSNPDLILLDIDLPDNDGFSVARILRSDSRTENIPIVFLTAHGERDERLAGLGLGADDYIEKPFDVQVLRLRVERFLRRR